MNVEIEWGGGGGKWVFFPTLGDRLGTGKYSICLIRIQPNIIGTATQGVTFDICIFTTFSSLWCMQRQTS